MIQTRHLVPLAEVAIEFKIAHRLNALGHGLTAEQQQAYQQDGQHSQALDAYQWILQVSGNNSGLISIRDLQRPAPVQAPPLQPVAKRFAVEISAYGLGKSGGIIQRRSIDDGIEITIDLAAGQDNLATVGAAMKLGSLGTLAQQLVVAGIVDGDAQARTLLAHPAQIAGTTETAIAAPWHRREIDGLPIEYDVPAVAASLHKDLAPR
jgi:hypothetical protein